MKTPTTISRIVWTALLTAGILSLGLGAWADTAPVGVVAEIQNPTQGKALWRAGDKDSWHEVAILQNLAQDHQLAVEGETQMRVFLFRDKNLVDLTTQTASTAKPYIVSEKKVKDKSTKKLIEGLKFVSEGLPGPLRDTNLQMTDLLTRSPEPYCVLIAPRNTRIVDPTPQFEWFESYGQPVTVTLSLDGKTLWKTRAEANETCQPYPINQEPLEEEKIYTIRLESPDSKPDVSNCTYQPLSKREAKEEAEWDETLPPKTEVAGAVLRAVRMISSKRLDQARQILTKALELHPDDMTLRGLLIAVYIKQGNGCQADREIEEYEKRKGA